MKKSLFFLSLLISTLGLAQSKLPVIKANSKNVKIRDGLNFKPNFWYIMPETNPDIYYVDLPIKTQSVSFITDQDSIRFEVKYGQHYDFIILLHNKDSCNQSNQAFG